ncbi:winged helix-turn-helix transcriptional regulator [Dactylosporangium sp. CS-033363]|uniref:winged helix-turn-helix transcriptional regulator n=1 Tax=Dactylosporangium sp. CS-033363 TaxID=3239935 RepID=UPI003D937B64
MRPKALEFSVDNCTIGRAMAILGERWTIVVLREVFNGIFRFDDMRVRTGIPRQVLTNRLGVLVDNGILRRVPYREPGARARDEYKLTEKGFDLYPMFVALREWGDRYLADPGGPPLETVHRGCGAHVHAELVCDEGHAGIAPRDVVPQAGPGAIRRVPAEV